MTAVQHARTLRSQSLSVAAGSLYHASDQLVQATFSAGVKAGIRFEWAATGADHQNSRTSACRIADIEPGSAASKQPCLHRGLWLRAIDAQSVQGWEATLIMALMAAVSDTHRVLTFSRLVALPSNGKLSYPVSLRSVTAQHRDHRRSSAPELFRTQTASVTGIPHASGLMHTAAAAPVSMPVLQLVNQPNGSLYDRRHVLGQNQQRIVFSTTGSVDGKATQRLSLASLEAMSKDWLNDPISTPARRRRLIHEISAAIITSYVGVASYRAACYLADVKSAVTLQSLYRGERDRKQFARLVVARKFCSAVSIQCWFRGAKARRKAHILRNRKRAALRRTSAVKLRYHIRSWLARRRSLRQREQQVRAGCGACWSGTD